MASKNEFKSIPSSADSDCSYEIKRCLLLGRKVTTNLDSILLLLFLEYFEKDRKLVLL